MPRVPAQSPAVARMVIAAIGGPTAVARAAGLSRGQAGSAERREYNAAARAIQRFTAPATTGQRHQQLSDRNLSLLEHAARREGVQVELRATVVITRGDGKPGEIRTIQNVTGAAVGRGAAGDPYSLFRSPGAAFVALFPVAKSYYRPLMPDEPPLQDDEGDGYWEDSELDDHVDVVR